MVAKALRTVHTSNVTLKNAVLLALVGMILVTILLTVDFINATLGFVHDVVPAVALLRSLVYMLASLSTAMLFYVFYRAQP